MSEANAGQAPNISASTSILMRYSQLTPLRDNYLDRAYDNAQLTIPYLMPEKQTAANQVGDTDTLNMQHDYNTEGAKLVTGLANHYIQTLFPAGRSFVKLRLEEPDQALQSAKGRTKGDIDATFASVERDLRQRFEGMGAREIMLDLLKHLIVCGNALIYKPEDGKIQLYALDEYVVHRGLDGKLNEIITLDKKIVGLLPDGLRELVMAEMKIDLENINTTTCNLYTHVIRKGVDPEFSTKVLGDDRNDWVVRQSVEGHTVGQDKELKADDMRWHPQGWVRTRREQYSRSLVEEHFGSFWVLAILTEALTKGAVTMADIKYLVRPGSMLDPLALTSSESGTFHYGEPDDVGTIDRKHDRDFKLVKDIVDMYKRHLGEVFMNLPSQMRDAERVTAEENHLRAQSLEKSHGGVFSQLAQNLQEPLAKLILSEMDISGLDETGVIISIVTGFDALARGQENENILLWIRDLAATQNLPEAVVARMKWDNFMKTTAAGRDVDHSKLLMSEQELAQVQAQNQANEVELEQARTRAKAGAVDPSGNPVTRSDVPPPV